MAAMPFSSSSSTHERSQHTAWFRLVRIAERNLQVKVVSLTFSENSQQIRGRSVVACRDGCLIKKMTRLGCTGQVDRTSSASYEYPPVAWLRSGQRTYFNNTVNSAAAEPTNVSAKPPFCCLRSRGLSWVLCCNVCLVFEMTYNTTTSLSSYESFFRSLLFVMITAISINMPTMA
jgi:hypothetical protein